VPVTEDKARFVKEIEQALLDGEIDLAVHSAKDVPGELPDGLTIVGVPERADPRDALCLPGGVSAADALRVDGESPAAAAATSASPAAGPLDALREGAVVGTASLRRRAQLLALRPDLDIRELRGNVDTRLRRLEQDSLDAIVLAAAGLLRLGRAEAGAPLPDDALVPAPGQGCLALEARIDDDAARDIASRLTDPDALAALTAERALVTGIDATCHTPVGAYATVESRPGDGVHSSGVLRLRAFVGTPDGATWIRDEIEGDRDDPAALGNEAATRLLTSGARAILAAAEGAGVSRRQRR
jgi:hydroxymethylbilane synthase